MKAWALGAIMLALAAAEGFADSLLGKVIEVLDGDAIMVADARGTEHWVRLAGVDAPEKRQPFAEAALEALGAKLLDRRVRVDIRAVDPYDRVIGDVYLDDRWINRELVDQGLAWHYAEVSDNLMLAQAEAMARNRRDNLWSGDEPVPPWEHREEKRNQTAFSLDEFLERREEVPDPYDLIAEQRREAAAEAAREDPSLEAGIAVPGGWMDRAAAAQPGGGSRQTADKAASSGQNATPRASDVPRYSTGGSR